MRLHQNLSATPAKIKRATFVVWHTTVLIYTHFVVAFLSIKISLNMYIVFEMDIALYTFLEDTHEAPKYEIVAKSYYNPIYSVWPNYYTQAKNSFASIMI